MKKALLATTALLLTAGAAAAEVTISGNGRFGLSFNDSRDDADPNLNTTIIEHRLRFNIDAKTETDAGVTFGGRIRLQYDDGDAIDLQDEGGAELNAAQLYVEAAGVRVEVGNVNTAYDSAGLMYNSEIGFIGESFGDPAGSYFGYSSGPYGNVDQVGLFAEYAVGDFVARISLVNPDQTGATAVEEELSISVDYVTGPFSLSAAYATNGAGIDGNDLFFIGGEYALNDTVNIGLQYFDNGNDGTGAGGDLGTHVTLYGNATFGATTVRGYVASYDDEDGVQGFTEDFAIGIGADYDLGGATLAGSIEKGFNDETRGSLGVKFSF
jgi:outer membrane protein OmpU